MTFYSKSLFSKGGDFFFGNADIGIKTFTNLLIYSRQKKNTQSLLTLIVNYRSIITDIILLELFLRVPIYVCVVWKLRKFLYSKTVFVKVIIL